MVDWGAVTSKFLGFNPILGLFVIMTLGTSVLPIPSEVVVVLAMFLDIHWVIVFWVCVIASTLGGISGYLLGYLGEEKIVKLKKKGKFKHVMKWFKKNGKFATFIARAVPGFPYKTYSLVAGFCEEDLKEHAVFTFAGNLIRVGILVYVGGSLKQGNYLTAAIFIIALVIFWIVVDKKVLNRKH